VGKEGRGRARRAVCRRWVRSLDGRAAGAWRAAIQQHCAPAALSLRALAFATSGDVGYIIGAFATAKARPTPASSR
jgi:hypothetical protein